MILNSRQKAIVETADGPCVIVAGPGTGKTRALAHRIAYLMEQKRIPPSAILAVTFTRSAALEMRERVKMICPLSAALAKEGISTFHAAAWRILQEQGVAVDWERIQKEETFDELLVSVTRLFQEKPAVLEQYRNRFRYILVDEFQDTSLLQYGFFKQLAGENVCVIGDPDQAIYGGLADQACNPFEQFQKDFPCHSVFSLSENYRSQGVIVEAAKQVITKNHSPLPRQLQARLEQGFPVEISAHQSDSQEAEMIVKKIEGLLGGASYFTIDSRWAQKESESYSYGLGEMAIFYRFHAQAKKLEQALERAGIPFQTFGKKSLEEEIITAGDRITLMTLHRSKGLEFPVVFLTGCEEGVLPYEESDLEEERRLFYVGMTRAKRRLFLSYAKTRFLFGKMRKGGPSPFLQDIEEKLRILQQSRAPAKKKASAPAPRTLFEL